MGTWKELALNTDLPNKFSNEIDGLVPSPNLSPFDDGRHYVLSASGTWQRRSNNSSHPVSFSELIDAPGYSDAQIGMTAKLSKGIRISSITADGATVTVHCLTQHGFSSGASVTIEGCNISGHNGSKTIATVIGSVGTEAGDSTAFTFASTTTGTVTIPGQITNSSTAEHMIIWGDDINILSGGTITSSIDMDGNDITGFNVLDGTELTLSEHITLEDDKKVYFGDAGEFITGDGTNLNLQSSGAIALSNISGDTRILIGDADAASRFEVGVHAQGVGPMLAVSGEADSTSDLHIYEAGGSTSDDYFRIRVNEHGATTISTVDTAGAAASLEVIADGNLTLAGANTKFKMSVPDDASDVDGECSGDIIYEPTSYSSGVTGVPGKCYYIKGNTNDWSETDASNEVSTRKLIAIATNANASKGLVLRGVVKLSHDVGGDPGNPVYLSETAAELTTTAPTTSGAFVRVVGYLISTVSSKSTIYFNPDNTYIEIA